MDQIFFTRRSLLARAGLVLYNICGMMLGGWLAGILRQPASAADVAFIMHVALIGWLVARQR